MGYTTEFEGYVTISPALDFQEIDYLNKFSDSRRMHREEGPFYVDGPGFMGQDRTSTVINEDKPDPSQPSLWCSWVPSKDGTTIGWNGGEKFYNAVEWMRYIIQTFLTSKPPKELPFFKYHRVDGEIYAQGQESDDKWLLQVENNKVVVKQGRVNVHYE